MPFSKENSEEVVEEFNNIIDNLVIAGMDVEHLKIKNPHQEIKINN